MSVDNGAEAQVKEGVLERRREVRAWQLLRARQARFEYLSGRWVDAARDIEEKQRQTRMFVTHETCTDRLLWSFRFIVGKGKTGCCALNDYRSRIMATVAHAEIASRGRGRGRGVKRKSRARIERGLFWHPLVGTHSTHRSITQAEQM